ncbi:MAG: coproporphyrinogen dehydrogenase HemZ [Clostridiales Family XIII bacterium]|jgi:oxygen-independent coproporphyrinogen-3 oxidase|nr:coproporphyrinogen dehydrogenase HemZ [Clostridiales Family XIII bacterium]
MHTFIFNGVKNPNEYAELIRMFLRPSEFSVSEWNPEDGTPAAGGTGRIVRIPEDLQALGDRCADKRRLYDILARETGKSPQWGILTGVRPVKLFGDLAETQGIEAAKKKLAEEYYLERGKIELLSGIYAFQRRHVPLPEAGGVGLYIGIPFCPTRCEYCSFPSNQAPYARILDYLAALRLENDFVADRMQEKGLFAESVYIGGGTPTSLAETDLDALLSFVERRFSSGRLREFTVEAGRPDTITAGKLRVMRKHGVDRISINPQSMNEATLARIGRRHSAEDVRQAFRMAEEAEIPCVNADLIAGLPGETAADFRRSLEQILDLAPENITLHTLAVKRAARLKETDAEFGYARAGAAEEMLELAAGLFAAAGYAPYYLYRLKQTAGNLENVGYAKRQAYGLYNVRIMEEKQSILAMGAGASTKFWFPQENRLERVFNVSNYEQYIQRIDEMLERKSAAWQRWGA